MTEEITATESAEPATITLGEAPAETAEDTFVPVVQPPLSTDGGGHRATVLSARECATWKCRRTVQWQAIGRIFTS